MTTNKSKKTFWEMLNIITSKCFEILKSIAKFLSHFLSETCQAFIYITKLLFGHLVDPTAYCVAVICFFGAVMIAMILQWYGFGVWIGGLLGLSQFGGYSCGFLGGCFGLGINLFQLGSKLNKFNKGIGEYWSRNNVETKESGADKALNWLDSKHRSMRNMSQISYLVELGLMAFYVVVTFNPWNLFWGLVSLIAPEKSLDWAVATLELLGGDNGKQPTSAPPNYRDSK
jgi:hypothetical protein